MKAILFIHVLVLSLKVHKTSAKLKNQVVKLDEGNWRDMVEGEWLVKFYAPWCPACRAIEPIWEKIADWSQDLNIHVGAVDVSDEAGLSGRFFITALPTIYHVKDGEFRHYLGSRTEDDIINYIEDGKYTEVEAVSWWKSPDSIQMSMLSAVFRISMQVRLLHNKLTEEFGFPVWLSYIVFAILTIATGLLLGLILVLLADCLCPPRPRTRMTPLSPESEERKKDDMEKDVKNDEAATEEKTNKDEKEVISELATKAEYAAVRQRKVATKEGEAEEKNTEL